MTHLQQVQKQLPENTWFLIPRTDRFQGEYVAPHDERLAWISGFTGSAGMALISKDKALLFVDGRYTVQAKDQVDSNWQVIHIADQTLESYLLKNLKGQKILFDPWLQTKNEISKWSQACTIEAMDANPIDQLWQDRPKPKLKAAVAHGIVFSGEPSGNKRIRILESSGGGRCHSVNGLFLCGLAFKHSWSRCSLHPCGSCLCSFV